MPVDPLGDMLIRTFIRLALPAYAVSLFLRCHLRSQDDWSAESNLGTRTRVWWTFGFALYSIHVALAFHYYHHWSHDDAVQRTQEVSGFGEGIYFSHAFTVLWGLDVLAWWVRPTWYARRSAWWERGLHAYMLFIAFNGAVVFAAGPVRWVSLAGFLTLAGCWLVWQPGGSKQIA